MHIQYNENAKLNRKENIAMLGKVEGSRRKRGKPSTRHIVSIMEATAVSSQDLRGTTYW